MHEEMRNYWNDESIQYKWDTLQRDFQCCGALNLRTGELSHHHIIIDQSEDIICLV